MIGVEELGDRVKSLAAAKGGERFILGIVGAPGAGKSTLAEAIVGRLGGGSVLVPMDGFHLAHAVLESHGSAERKGAPDTFDAGGFVALLQRVRADADACVYAPAFDRTIEEPIAGAIPVEAHHRLIVVEGNYLLLDDPGWRDIPPLVDEFWFLSPPAELRRERLVGRHQEFGKSLVDARTWVNEVDEHNAELIDRGRSRADLIIEDWQ